MGKHKEKWGKACGELPLAGISQTLSQHFSSRFIHRRNNSGMSGNLHCFPRTCFFEKRSEISAGSKTRQKDGRSTGSSMYLAVKLWVAIVGYGKV